MRRLAEGFLGLVLLCVVAASSYAESPYAASVKGDTSSLVSLSEDLQDGVVRRASPIRTFSALRLSFAAKGLGQIKLVLNDISYKSWNSYIQTGSGSQVDGKDVILVNGFVEGLKGKKQPVGGSLYRSGGHPRLFLVINGGKHSKRSAYVRVRLDGKKKILPARVSTLPESATDHLTCGSDGQPMAAASSGNAHAAGTTTGAAVIATDADPEYYAAYGADTNAHIATLISAASAIYRNDLGIRLRVGTQHVFSSSSGNPYTSTASGTLLSQFQNYTRANNHLGVADAYHLFSGKDFDTSIIGLAYVATVCEYPDYAFGTTQKYNPASDASIFAHELGHNFGATHDNTDAYSLMAPYVRIPGSTYFSAASKALIQSHLSGAPTCLDPVSGDDPDPEITPAPTATPDPSDPSGDPAPEASLSVSVGRKGTLDLTMTVSSVRSDCTLSLYGATSALGEGRLVSDITVSSSGTTRIRLTGLKRPARGKTSLYFWTEYDCGTDLSSSDVEEANLNVIAGRTSQKIGNILNSIVNAFSSQKKRNKRIG